MSDIEMLKLVSNTGGLALALYVVFLIVRLMLEHLKTRSAAADELALKTIEVFSKNTEALGHIGRGMEAVATSQAHVADVIKLIFEGIKGKS